ncbi:hypothetical protein LHJ74_31860 [Streptomyces sp. N2-109]|uniref:Uncharacterized protein n=1 Tax=Streptomyces gossypii TaxID=2883101 RepID=A0ABT2K2X9_9ACTN|nr:hypothetical protein [Streptomyces gossypii]MCT2594451.1 hypothetical protein [Streptomyces gossypii]
MRIQIGVPGDALASSQLHAHLRRHPDTRRLPLEHQLPAGGTSEMGALDTITAVLDSGVGVGGLAVALAAWRTQRRGTRAERTLRLERDGQVVTLTGYTPEEAERVLRTLAADPAPAPAPEPDGDGPRP